MKTQNPYSRFYSLLAAFDSPDREALKEQLIWQYSNMLTTSLKEFCKSNPAGYEAMCRALEAEVKAVNATAHNFREREIKRLRSAILHRLQRYGIDTTNWIKVNKFLEQPRLAGKRLYEMSIEEMADLIPKLESMLAKMQDKQIQEHNLTKLN